MKNYIFCIIMAGLLATSGCAWYDITAIKQSEVKADNWGKDSKDGYVIYQPELYFAATIASSMSTNVDKGITTNQSISVAPLYLPNPAKAYRVTTHNFLGKADFEFTFQNGWQLTQLNDKSDNTTVATALAGQLQTILTAAGAITKNAAPPNKLRVFLYKPEYADDGTITNFSAKGELETGAGGN